MKKITALILALSILFTLAACSLSKPKTEKELRTLNRGTVTGKTYKSDYIGIQCTLDDSWEIYNEDQLAQLAGLTAEQIQSDELKKQLEKTATVYDFYAAADGGLSTININMTATNTMGLSASNEAEIAKLVKPQMETTLSQTGLENCKIELTTMKFAGKERQCFRISGTVNGMQIYESEVLLLCDGGVAVYITACTFNEDNSAALLEKFTALE